VNTNSQEKLAKFFSQYRWFLYKVAKKTCYGGTSPFDVVQRTFITLLRPEYEIDWDNSPVNYIARQVEWTASNMNQLENKHRRAMGGLDGGLIPAPAVDLDTVLDVRAAIERGFKGEEREVVIAFFIEGVKGEELFDRFPSKHPGSWRRWITLTATRKLKELLIDYAPTTN